MEFCTEAHFLGAHPSSVAQPGPWVAKWPLHCPGHFIAQYFNIVNFVHKDNLNCQWAWWLAPWYSAMMTMSELERLYNKDIIYPLLSSTAVLVFMHPNVRSRVSEWPVEFLNLVIDTWEALLQILQ